MLQPLSDFRTQRFIVALFLLYTVIPNTLEIGQKNPLSHELGSEQMSERVYERAQRSARAK